MVFFWQLFKTQSLLFYRELFAGKKYRPLLFIAALVLPYFTFNATLHLFKSWQLLNDVTPRLYMNFLSTSLFGFLVFLSFSGIPIALHQITNAKDLPILLPKPISRPPFFRYKLFMTSLYNSTLFLFFGLPVLLAFLFATKASILGFLFTIIAVFFYIQFPAFNAALISLGFLRLTSFNKARNLASALVGILFIAGWAGIQFLKLDQLDPLSSDFEIIKLQQFAQIQIWDFIPSNWFANALVFSSTNLSLFLLYALLLAGFAIVLLFMGGRLFDKAHKNDWISAGSLNNKSAVVPGQHSVFFQNSSLFSLFKKDLLLFTRDSRHSTSIILLLVMMIVFPFLLESHETGYGEFPPAGFMALFASVIAANIASRIIPFEGNSFKLNLLVPQPIAKIYAAKLLVSTGLTAIPILIGMIVFAYRFALSPALIGLSVIIVVGVAINAASLGLFMGLKFANYKWENPKQLLKQPGPFLLILFTVLFSAVALTIVLSLYFFISFFIAIIAFTTFIVIVQFVLTKLSTQTLKKLEWLF